jgi:hypothetical protein
MCIVRLTEEPDYFGSGELGTEQEPIFSVPVLSVPVPGSFGSVLGSRFSVPRLIPTSGYGRITDGRVSTNLQAKMVFCSTIESSNQTCRSQNPCVVVPFAIYSYA